MCSGPRRRDIRLSIRLASPEFAALPEPHARRAACSPPALLSVAGAARTPGPRARSDAGPAQFLGQWQQRVRCARDDLACDVDDPLTPAARDGPELLECLPRPDAVPFGQHPDRLLHADPDGQRALQLADRDPEAPCLIVAAFVTGSAVTGSAVTGRLTARRAVTGYAAAIGGNAACLGRGAGRLGS